MALSKKDVEHAIKILKEICDYCCVAKISERTWMYEEMPPMPNIIVCLGEKEDGGFDNVYIEIKNMNADVLEKFHKRKNEIHNSPIERKDDEITRIGWF